jgi:hypothetical protein
VQFTKAPPRTVGKAEIKPVATSIHVSLPLDLEGPAKLVAEAIPERLPHLVHWLQDVACAKRTQWVECQSARIDLDVVRDGNATLVAEAGRLVVKVPMKYELAAKGIGWANAITDKRSGAFVLITPIETTLSAGYVLGVEMGEDRATGEPVAAVMKGQLDVAKMVQPRIRQALAPIGESVRAALQGLAVKDSAARALRALQRPIELSKSPDLWLVGEPSRISGEGIWEEGGKLRYRMSIGTKLVIVDAPPIPAPQSAIKRMLDPTKPSGEPSKSQVRLPVFIGLDRIERAAETAFPRGEKLETRADRFAEPVTVSVQSAKVFPSQRQVALELELKVVSPKSAAGQTGKAYLIGRPVFKGADGVLGLESIAFPAQTAKDAAQQSERPAGVRLGLEPFATRFANAARVDLAREIKETLPAAQSMLNQPIEADLALEAQLREGAVVAIDPVKGGLLVTIELAGDIGLRDDAGTLRTAPEVRSSVQTTADTAPKPKAAPAAKTAAPRSR